MTTAAVLINDALQFINVSSSIMPAEPEEQSRAFSVLKRLYDSLPSQGIYLELRRPATVSADIREPGYSTEALVAILGKTAAPYFQAQLSQEQFSAYEDAMNMLRRKTMKRPRSSYPGTLPIGSGHYYNSEFFYYTEESNTQTALFDQANIGESRVYSADFGAEATRRNTTVSSVAWASIGAESATVSDVALASSVATARITYDYQGSIIVRARCTFANSEVYDWILKVDVGDPVIHES